MKRKLQVPVILTLTCLLLSGCVRPAPDTHPWLLDGSSTPAASQALYVQSLIPTPRLAGSPYYTPTPDSPHTLPALRTDAIQYSVQSGDTLSLIASRYDLPVTALISANPDINPEILEVGQVINIPAPQPAPAVSDFKIIPDSELVYGPASADLDVASFISQYGGFLNSYTEDVDGEKLSGAGIVERVSYEYSVNPRLLLALLEYQSDCVTHPVINFQNVDYPMGRIEITRSGLYKQLAWTANTLNQAYYLYQINAFPYVILSDGSQVMLSTIINAGTAAVQSLEAQLNDLAGYQKAISEGGVYATYTSLFGIPFDRAIEPLLPDHLSQPFLQLPFEKGAVWSFTGGPHGGWDEGSAWAALDFAPPGNAYGCVKSDAWEVAAADGVIVRSNDGAVVIDLDSDGLEQTGWTLLYMHVESRDRIKTGTSVKAGDRIGHPSCEGGVSNGTHLHLARRYNGEWISADGNLPFNLEGWISSGQGVEYDGTLTKNGQVVTAWDGRIAENQIQR